MAYRIISPRVGVPGAIWEPTEGVNVEALIAGAFIEQTSPAKGDKSARKEPINEAPDAHQNIEE